MDNQTFAFVLIAVGVVFLLSEVFLPTGGILFGVAVLLELVGVVMVFVSSDMTTGLVTLAGVFIGIPALSIVAFSYWPYTPMAKQAAQANSHEQETVAAMPGITELEILQGRYGRTTSPLRPAGMAEFDGRRVDVMSEGLPIPEGAWVRCIVVKAGKVVVRQIEQPAALDDFDTNSL